MRHDWVFDVLSDLQDYAAANGMPGLAAKVAETAIHARQEITAACKDAAASPMSPALNRAH